MEDAGRRTDILAERFADDPELRALIRQFTYSTGLLVSGGEDTGEIAEAKEFQMYFDYYEDVAKIPPHRVLAINRGERLKVLRVNLRVDEQKVYAILNDRVINRPSSPSAAQIRAAVEDGYKRLLGPSLEREIEVPLQKRQKPTPLKSLPRTCGIYCCRARCGATGFWASTPRSVLAVKWLPLTNLVIYLNTQPSTPMNPNGAGTRHWLF